MVREGQQFIILACRKNCVKLVLFPYFDFGIDVGGVLALLCNCVVKHSTIWMLMGRNWLVLVLGTVASFTVGSEWND